MTTPHAPGPWTIHGIAVKCIDHQRYYTIARVDNPRFTSEGNQANARLIAAAPELLEALTWAVETADAEQYEASWYANARAAIAKATGEPVMAA